MTFNRKQFFTGFRELIDPTIEQTQVDGLNFLLGKMEADPFWVHIPQIAYALATVYHETAGSMQPVEEGFYLEEKHGKAYLKRFQKSLKYFPYFGRGYVQLTWKKNYEKAEAEFGHDLVKHPENALDPEVAYLVLTYGMHQGWFTGKKLDDYIKGAKKDYVNARRIVNGIDKAGLIAGYAKSFEEILTDSTADPATDGSLIKSNSIQNTANDGSQGQSSIDSSVPDASTEQNVAVVREESLGFWSTLGKKITAAFTGIGGATGLTTYAQQGQSFGLSSLFWERIFYMAIVGFLGWIIIEVIRWFYTTWQKRKRTNTLVAANATPNNSVTVIRPEQTEEFQRNGWVVIGRG